VCVSKKPRAPCGARLPVQHARGMRMGRGSFLALVALTAPLARAEEWSFKAFMEGDWDLERRTDDGSTDHAHYSLKEGERELRKVLEGIYYEEKEDGRHNEMVVLIEFDDAKSGQFMLARSKPDGVAEPKTAFEFNFHGQSGDHLHISESKWLGRAGGTAQFLVADDSFVFTKTTCSPYEKPDGESVCKSDVSVWTAVRKGGPRKKPEAKKSLLQRRGWTVFALLLFVGYQAAKEKMK
jgi:hypothetical protein